jgi:hypothetical protein
MNRQIVDIYHVVPGLPPDPKKLRNFMILCRAFGLGIIKTDATLAEVNAMAEHFTNQTIGDLVTKIVILEGNDAKYVIPA